MPQVIRHEPPAPGVTEIRVHGVGGGTPQSLLHQTGVHQVTGDDTAGLYRGAVDRDTRTVEAYSWGGLTAKDRTRAFWVLLLPFSLINLAGWMVEPAGDDPLRPTLAIKVHEGVVLGIGLVTTAMYVMWAALLTMNVAAFQCGALSACSKGRWYLAYFDHPVFRDHPGRRLLVGLLLPLALLGLFVLLGSASRERYDEYGEPRGAPDAASAGGSPLGLRGFWFTSRWQVQASLLHVAAVLAVLGGLLARATAEFEARFITGLRPNVGMWLFWAAVVIAIATVAAVVPVLRHYTLLIGLETRRSAFPAVLVALSGAVCAAAALLAWQMDVPDTRLVMRAPSGALQPVTDLWGFGWAPVLLLAAAIALVGAFSAIQVWGWISAPPLYFDQFLVPTMLVLVVFWRHAAVIIPATIVTAVAVDLVARRRGNRSADIQPWRLRVYVGALGIALVVRLVSGGGSRLTPLLVFAVVLAFLCAARAKGVAERVFPGAVGAAVVVAGWVLATWTAADEWVHVGAGFALVVIAMTWMARFDDPGYRGFRWNGPGAVAILALTLIAGAFSGGIIRVVDVLDDGGAIFDLRATGIYEWIVLGFAATVTASLAAGLAWYGNVFLCLWRASVRKPAPRPDYQVLRWQALATAVRGVDVLITLVGMLMLTGWLALADRLMQLHGRTFTAWIDEGTPASWAFVVDVASYAALGLAVGAFLSIRRGLRDPAFRTQIGILWDVASFWPRSFHPFAPPSYASRAVPELQARMAEVAAHGGQTILSGHSQGAVVSLAAVAALPDDVRRTVALVTHGSPLGRFYQPFFPRQFADAFLRERGIPWLNFFRRTDPIGDPILPGVDDGALRNVELRDPVDRPPSPYRPAPSLRQHLGYLADPVMAEALDGLAVTLGARCDRSPRRGRAR